MIIMGIDPGSSSTGVAFLRDGAWLWGACLTSRDPPGPTAPSDPIARWFVRLAALIRKYQATVVAYESYEYQGNKRTTANAPLMWQQVGAVRCLLTLPLVSSLHAHEPGVWRQQLTGDRRAGDQLVDRILQHRLGVSLLNVHGQTTGSHILDATGVALVTWDTLALLKHAT